MKKLFGIIVLVSIALLLISCGGGGGGGGGGAVAPAGTGTGTTTGTGSGTGTSSSIIASFHGCFIIDDYQYETLWLREDGTAVFLVWSNDSFRLYGTYSFPSDELCTITVPSGTVNLSICDSGYIVIPSNGTLTASGWGYLGINYMDPDELSYYESIEHVDNEIDLFNAIAPQAKNDIRSYCKCFSGVGDGFNDIGYANDDYHGLILCNGHLQCAGGNSKEDMLNQFVPGAHGENQILYVDGYENRFKYIPEGDAAHGEGFYITFFRYLNDDQYGSFHVGDYSVGEHIFAGIYNNGNLYLYKIYNSMLPYNLHMPRDQFLELLNRLDANTYASLRSDILSISDYASGYSAGCYPCISFDHYADYGTSFNHSWSCDYNYIFGLVE